MFRTSPLWILLSLGVLLPLACSSDEESGDGGTSATKGTGSGSGLLGTGGSATGGSAAGDGDGDTSGKKLDRCTSFVGLDQCGAEAVSAESNLVNMLLVIDKSGSMDTPPDPDSPATLWDATTTALNAAISSANEKVSFGIQIFPKNMGPCEGGECCQMPEGEEITVPIKAGDENRQLILTQLERTSPEGGTPTAQALERAYLYFQSGEGLDLEGDRFILLATDGGPNCNEDLSCESEQCTYNIDDHCEEDTAENPTNCCAGSALGCLDDTSALDQIKALRKIGVDTFVVGLAGSEQYAMQLDAFAEAGGREREGEPEKYFKVGAKGSSEGLEKVLNKITRDLVQSCDLQLNKAPADKNKINVAVDCDIVKSGGDADGSGQGGDASEADAASYWVLDTDTSPPTVRIRGDICDKIKSEGVERVDIVQGCTTIR